jgi:hypothetical protein
MRPVMQRRLGVGGDCFLACLAGLLEIPIESVPDFQLMEKPQEWHLRMMEFLEKHGCDLHGSAYGDRALTYEPGIDGYYIVAGDSPRGLVRGHSVIFYKGKMVHDPHPSGEGITAIRSAFMIERIGAGT